MGDDGGAAAAAAEPADAAVEWAQVEYAWKARYRGGVRGREREGRGLWRHPNGEEYEGEWRAGRRHGWGRYRYEDGAQYWGEWRGGLMDGDTGVYHLTARGRPLDESYVGGYAGGCKHGEGMYSNAAEDRYALQEWEHGTLRCDAAADAAAQVAWHRRALATLQAVDAAGRAASATDDDDDLHYTADMVREEWERSVQRREHTFPSGAVYVGEFDGDSFKRHGVGKWNHPQSGDSYEGEFSRNLKQGWGVYRFRSIDRTYIGSWHADKMHGWGVLLFGDGGKCVGRFLRDERAGLCVHFLPGDGGECRLQTWRDAELREERDAARGDAAVAAYTAAEALIRDAAAAVAAL